MNKGKISIALALASVGTVAAVVTSGVFIGQEVALTKDIETLKNKRETLNTLKKIYPKHAQEINQILEKNPLVRQLAHEDFSDVHTKIYNLHIAINQLTQNSDSILILNKENYNLLSQQVQEYLNQISNKENYKNIYGSLKQVKDSTDNNVNKQSVTQNEIDLETKKLQDAFDLAKARSNLKDKLVEANDFNSGLTDSKYLSIKKHLQEVIDNTQDVYNNKKATKNEIIQATNDLEKALKDARKNKISADGNKIVESDKYPEYIQTLKDANDLKNKLSKTQEYNKVTDYLDTNIQKSLKDSDGKDINSTTPDLELIKAINQLKKDVSNASKEAFNTATSLAQKYLNNFSDSKYSSFKTSVEDLLNKYNKNVDSKTNQQLQNQGDEIINAIKSGRTKAEQKYDEILMFAKFFLADLTDNEETQTKYVDIINGLKDSINTQNLIRNDSKTSAKDILEAKDKLLEDLNKAIVNKKILDSGSEEDLKKLAFENYKKQREQLKQYNDSLDISKYSDIKTEIENTINTENAKVTASPTDLDNPKSEVTTDDIKKATKALKQALQDAKEKALHDELLKAQQAYDAIVDEVKNNKLSESKYDGLKAAFEAENKPNQTVRDTEQTDKVVWTSDINNAASKAQVISNKLDEAKQKFDDLDSKRTEVQDVLSQIPEGDEYQEIHDILQNALNADANKNEGIVKNNPIDVANWDTAIDNLDNAIIQAKKKMLTKVKDQAIEWSNANLTDPDKNELNNSVQGIFVTNIDSNDKNQLDQAIGWIKEKLEQKQKEKVKQEHEEKIQDIKEAIENSHSSNSINGDNELALIEATEELINADTSNMSPEEIKALNDQIQQKIEEFNKKTAEEAKYWKTPEAEKETSASKENKEVTINNFTVEDPKDKNLLWTLNNNDMRATETSGDHPYSDLNLTTNRPQDQDGSAFKLLKKATIDFGNYLKDKIDEANIGDETELDKFMHRTLNKSIEEMNVLATMSVTSSSVHFDQNTVLIKYLRRYYGSNLSNEQYGLWSELAGHKLVPTFQPWRSDKPKFAPRFNEYSIINDISTSVRITSDYQWRKGYLELKPDQSLDDHWLWKRSVAGLYQYYFTYPTFMLTLILSQDGVYPIFEKSLDYVLKTYNYLKPEELSKLREKLMQGVTDTSEQLTIDKALATAKSKFMSALKHMQQNDSLSEDIDKYNKPLDYYINEIDTRLNSDASESAKKYLRQAKEFIVNQHQEAEAFDKAYTLQHAIDNFDVIIDSSNSDLIKNENESILDPRNMNEVIEAYAILIDLTNKYKDKVTPIEWLEPTHSLGPEYVYDPSLYSSVAVTYNQNKYWSEDERTKYAKYAAFESSKYTFKKNVDQKLDFVNRKLLTTYSSDDQTETRNKLQAKYSAWKTKYNEISSSGDDESAYEALLETVLSDYKEVTGNDLVILEN